MPSKYLYCCCSGSGSTYIAPPKPDAELFINIIFEYPLTNSIVDESSAIAPPLWAELQMNCRVTFVASTTTNRDE